MRSCTLTHTDEATAGGWDTQHQPPPHPPLPLLIRSDPSFEESSTSCVYSPLLAPNLTSQTLTLYMRVWTLIYTNTWAALFYPSFQSSWHPKRSAPIIMQQVCEIRFYGGVLRKSSGVSQLEERSCSVIWWYGCRYFGVFWQTAAGWTGPWVLSYLSDDTNMPTFGMQKYPPCSPSQ